MTDVGIDNSAPEAPPTVAPAPSGSDPVSVREAAKTLGKWRHERPKEEKPAPERAEVAAPAVEESTAQAEDAGVVEAQPPSETQETDPAEQPPIEPPRSWTKEDKELFAGLPRETQERLAERERSRDTDISRRQNEAAEARKAIEAERQLAEQARQQYEAALPQLLETLQQQQGGQFADIKTMADVQRLATEDPYRFSQWQVHNMQVAAVQQQVQQVQQARQAEDAQKFAEFAREQDRLFVEKVPDMADEKKAGELQKAAVASLESAGFTKDELGAAWNGNINVPFRDHRVMLMIHKASLWDKAQAQVKTITTNAKPIPPVQRPGAAQPKGAAQAAQAEALGKKLDNASGRGQLRAAADLLKLRRSAR